MHYCKQGLSSKLTLTPSGYFANCSYNTLSAEEPHSIAAATTHETAPNNIDKQPDRPKNKQNNPRLSSSSVNGIKSLKLSSRKISQNFTISTIALQYRLVLISIICPFLFMSSTVQGALFHGLDSSYLVYESWNGLTVGQLSFEIKTREDNGLLFYMDTNGTNNYYVMISVKKGELWFEYMLGGEIKNESLAVVNDNLWHKVRNFNLMPSFFYDRFL